MTDPHDPIVADDPVDPRDLAEVRAVLADAARQADGSGTLVLPPYLTVYALDHAHEMDQLRLLARDARNEEATRKRKARFPTMYLP